jgi:hypothetical protein
LHRDADNRASVEIDRVFREVVEPLIREQPIQARVERVTRRGRQIRRGDPHPRLSVAFPFAHRHGQSVVQEPNRGPRFTEVGER